MAAITRRASSVRQAERYARAASALGGRIELRASGRWQNLDGGGEVNLADEPIRGAGRGLIVIDDGTGEDARLVPGRGDSGGLSVRIAFD